MKKSLCFMLAGLCFLLLSSHLSQAGVLSVRGKALGSDGVTPLPGDGLPITGPEGYVQCVYAGPGGTIDVPNTDGSAGGDDVLLETAEYPGQFFTAVGEGFPFNPGGRFFEDFNHTQSVGAKFYVRVWNGQSPTTSTYYGNSSFYVLQNDTFDEHDFGQWATDVSLNPCIDLDGDGYGKPANATCPHPQLDCDDANPNVNPGMTEIPGNGVDDDCKNGTPPWGTPASVVSTTNAGRVSDVVNALLLLLAPVTALGVLRRFTSRRR